MFSITFVSNYMNHHQLPMSENLYKILGEQYHFIQTEKMEEERIAMGWGGEYEMLPFMRYYDRQKEECMQLIRDSDMVIYGGVDDESYIQERLQSGRPVLRYSERLYKEGQWKAISPRGLIKKYQDHIKYRNRPVYLLCSGAYVASDFHLIHAYPDKMFQWGYFPKMKQYSMEELFSKKQHHTIEILWAGRFIDWKHPESAVAVAQFLKEKKCNFHMTMVGVGDLWETIKSQITLKGLEDQITLTGFTTPLQVRDYMEKSNIFLFTSDFKEGWGAVLNEAMNSGCACVAGSGIGAVPSLIENGRNGYVYQNGNIRELCSLTQALIENRTLQYHFGVHAYETITSLWNEEYAAKKLVETCEKLLHRRVVFQSNGPLSQAIAISPYKGYSWMIKRGKKNHFES